MRRLLPVLALWFAGCISPVQSSALRTESAPVAVPARADPAAAPPVKVLLTHDPGGEAEIGVVEAHGRRPVATLEDLVAELRRRTLELGGDRVRVDAMGSRFELVTETYTYDCGTTTTDMQTRTVMGTDAQGHMTSRTETVPVTRHQPRTCTGSRQVEAETMTLTGRAFRGAPPESP